MPATNVSMCMLEASIAPLFVPCSRVSTSKQSKRQSLREIAANVASVVSLATREYQSKPALDAEWIFSCAIPLFNGSSVRAHDNFMMIGHQLTNKSNTKINTHKHAASHGRRTLAFTEPQWHAILRDAHCRRSRCQARKFSSSQ